MEVTGEEGMGREGKGAIGWSQTMKQCGELGAAASDLKQCLEDRPKRNVKQWELNPPRLIQTCQWPGAGPKHMVLHTPQPHKARRWGMRAAKQPSAITLVRPTLT